MASVHSLSESELSQALRELKDWTARERTIEAAFKFKTFRDAIAFIVQVAFEAEALNHHPDLRNVYNRVSFSLCTHDAGDAVTERDIELASRISALARRYHSMG